MRGQVGNARLHLDRRMSAGDEGRISKTPALAVKTIGGRPLSPECSLHSSRRDSKPGGIAQTVCQLL